MRRLKRLGTACVAAYLVMVLVLYFGQEAFLFPAHKGEVFPDDARISVQEIPTPDGETLVAWTGPDPAPGCPVLTFFHGNASRLDVEKWRHGRIMNAGLGLVAISYRGYSGSTGSPSETGLNIDAQAVYDWVLAKGVAPGDLVVQGHSLGSGVAVKLAAEAQVGALVLEAPFLSLLEVAKAQVPLMPVKWLLRHPFRSDLLITQIKEPLLVYHGSDDRLIPFAQSAALFDLATQPKTYQLMEGSDHNTLVRDGAYENVVWPFLSELYPDCGGLQ